MTEKTIIKIPQNFSFQETISFLDRGFDDCMYHLEGDSVKRLLRFEGENGLISIIKKDTNLEVEIQKETITKKDVAIARAFVVNWFDMERDIQPFYELLREHKILSDFPSRFMGSRLIGIPDLFEAICWAIIGQQINLPFAYKVKRNMVERYGISEVFDGVKYYLFPNPTVLANASSEVLAELKFSRQKIKYIKNVSDAFIKKELNLSILLQCQNRGEQMDKLTSIKGVGIWTANYVLMKSLRNMSCITYGDSGLNRALYHLFKTEKRPVKEVVDEIFSEFNGWESYLNFYLWKSIS